ncbi:hypothetical protein JXQ70_05525 [bacterium]|nr:hypothetical protein [bacterium]
MNRSMRLFSVLALIFFIQTETQVFAVTWAKHFHHPGAQSGAHILKRTDGTYLISALLTNSTASSAVSMFTVTENGDLLWARDYFMDNLGLYDVTVLSDGDFAIIGIISDDAGNFNAMYLKIDDSGTILVQKRDNPLGELKCLNSITTDSLGNIMAAGYFYFPANIYFALVIKTNMTGDVVWQKLYEFSTTEDGYAHDLAATHDNGFIIGGYKSVYVPQRKKHYNISDVLIFKVDSDGNCIWMNTIESPLIEKCTSVLVTTENEIMALAEKHSYNDPSSYDLWIIKLNEDGTLVWHKEYGGTGRDIAKTIIQTQDGNFVVVGSSSSFSDQSRDFWVMKIDASGTILWERTYGGSGDDLAEDILETGSGDYLIVGSTTSFDATDRDILILRTDAEGMIEDCSLVGTSAAAVEQLSTTVQTLSGSQFDWTVTRVFLPVKIVQQTTTVDHICPEKEPVPALNILGLCLGLVLLSSLLLKTRL